MKKVLLVALVATLIAVGCEKTEIINPQPEHGLTFSTNIGKLTKASDADNPGITNLQEQNFRVWAYAEYEDPNTVATELYSIYDGIENLAVTYTAGTEGATGTWGTEKQYFWPGVDKNLTFFAVSAGKVLGSDTDEFLGTSGEEADSLTITKNETTNSMVITNFNVKDQNYNRDLMVADGVTQHQGDKMVDLTFHHTLSKVEFLFKTNKVENTTDVINVWVQKVEVKDLATEGKLTATMAAGTPSGESTYQGTQNLASFTWELTDGKTASFTDDYVTPYEGTDFPTEIDGIAATDEDKIAMKITSAGTAEEPAQNFTTWLMLPQDITGKLVEITYLINERQFTSIFPLSTTSLTTWGVNQHIRYIVNLSPNLISFDATVDDWTTPSTDVEHQN